MAHAFRMCLPLPDDAVAWVRRVRHDPARYVAFAPCVCALCGMCISFCAPEPVCVCCAGCPVAQVVEGQPCITGGLDGPVALAAALLSYGPGSDPYMAAHQVGRGVLHVFCVCLPCVFLCVEKEVKELHTRLWSGMGGRG